MLMISIDFVSCLHSIDTIKKYTLKMYQLMTDYVAHGRVQFCDINDDLFPGFTFLQ